MYDIDTKNVKKGIIFYFIPIFFGIIILAALIFIFILSSKELKKLDSSVMSNNVKIESVINEEGSTMYKGIYYYDVDGITYKCSSSGSTSIRPSTKNKLIYYEKQHPTNCSTNKKLKYIILFFLVVPIVFLIIGIKNIIRINKRLKQISELNKKGKLVKNLPYYLEDSNISINNVRIKKPAVEYTLPSGTSITLYGDDRLDKKLADRDGLVDLVIDLDNPDNYFIDFEINRLSGNLKEDYYNNNHNKNINKE